MVGAHRRDDLTEQVAADFRVGDHGVPEHGAELQENILDPGSLDLPAELGGPGNVAIRIDAAFTRRNSGHHVLHSRVEHDEVDVRPVLRRLHHVIRPEEVPARSGQRQPLVRADVPHTEFQRAFVEGVGHAFVVVSPGTQGVSGVELPGIDLEFLYLALGIVEPVRVGRGANAVAEHPAGPCRLVHGIPGGDHLFRGQHVRAGRAKGGPRDTSHDGVAVEENLLHVVPAVQAVRSGLAVLEGRVEPELARQGPKHGRTHYRVLHVMGLEIQDEFLLRPHFARGCWFGCFGFANEEGRPENLIHGHERDGHAAASLQEGPPGDTEFSTVLIRQFEDALLHALLVGRLRHGVELLVPHNLGRNRRAQAGLAVLVALANPHGRYLACGLRA